MGDAVRGDEADLRVFAGADCVGLPLSRPGGFQVAFRALGGSGSVSFRVVCHWN